MFEILPRFAWGNQFSRSQPCGFSWGSVFFCFALNSSPSKCWNCLRFPAVTWSKSFIGCIFLSSTSLDSLMGLELNHFSKDLRAISQVLKHLIITGWSQSFVSFWEDLSSNFLFQHSFFPFILFWWGFSSLLACFSRTLAKSSLIHKDATKLLSLDTRPDTYILPCRR